MRKHTRESVSVPSGQHWVFWDGECGLCRECIDWLKKHDHDGLFITVAYQEAASPPMTPELREKCRKAVQVLTSTGELYGAGMACAFALERIGYRRLGKIMQSRMFRPIVEWGYRRVANNRGWLGRLIFGKKCAADKPS